MKSNITARQNVLAMKAVADLIEGMGYSPLEGFSIAVSLAATIAVNHLDATPEQAKRAMETMSAELGIIASHKTTVIEATGEEIPSQEGVH